MVWGLTKAGLYLYSQYFENLLTERLLGDGALRNALIESMNTVALEFFNRIVSESMNHVLFGAHVLHTDTTNFSLHGAYENSNPDPNTIKVAYCHPKDNRGDLKRFVLRIDGDLRNIRYK
ncbi:MAG: hypothetical protein EF813_03730 [Methanosarcinales archaeon]|nr:MAG: hypothetical protein EF813_03730 [Methanosarcinales archaeon]